MSFSANPSGTSWEFDHEDGPCQVEQWAECITIYVPVSDPFVGDRFGAISKYLDGTITESEGNLRTLEDGTIGFKDVVGDSGRVVAYEVLEAWEADPDTPQRVAEALKIRARQTAEEIERAIDYLSDKVYSLTEELVTKTAELSALQEEFDL